MEVMPLKGTVMWEFLITLNYFRIFEGQTSEVDAIPAPISLAQNWVKIG
jgi:hypothetical protein